MFKVLTVGDSAVGKTTLLNRYVTGKFKLDLKSTIGVDILKKELIIKDYSIMLQLWDFGGQEEYRFMQNRYALGSAGAVVMFDLTRPETLDNIEEWVALCRIHEENLPLILVGAKLDLVDETSIDETYVLQILKLFKFISFIKVSSKTGRNVELIFQAITENMLENQGFLESGTS